jgi:UDPglucose 6-dehydrogenase
MKISIIGNGFVGNAIYQTMKHFYDFCVYDIDESKSYNSFEEVNDTNIIFVCVPTPMSYKDGSFDLSIMKDSIRPLSSRKILIIKSTITPAAAEELILEYPEHHFIFNPEFLSEKTAVEDFKNQKRIVLGGDPKIVKKVEELYYNVFPDCEYIKTDYKTACFTKYLCNCFFAAKVALMNEFYEIAASEGVCWDTAMKGFIASGWVNPMHTMVPGPDGNRGFGGKCFPKDINAFIKYSEANNTDPIILKAAWNKNLKIRNNHDWVKIKGAISTED